MADDRTKRLNIATDTTVKLATGNTKARGSLKAAATVGPSWPREQVKGH